MKQRVLTKPEPLLTIRQQRAQEVLKIHENGGALSIAITYRAHVYNKTKIGNVPPLDLHMAQLPGEWKVVQSTEGGAWDSYIVHPVDEKDTLRLAREIMAEVL